MSKYGLDRDSGLMLPRRGIIVPDRRLLMGAPQQALLAVGAGGGVGGTWTPAELSPYAWFNDDSTISWAGSTVAQWHNLMGGENLTLSPYWSVPSTLTELGRRVVDYYAGGTSRGHILGYEGSARAICNNVTGAWAFYVARRTSLDGSDTWRFATTVCFNSYTQPRWRTGFGSGGSGGKNKLNMGARRLDADSVVSFDGPLVDDTDFHMALFVMDWSTGNGHIYLDGNSPSSASLTSSGSTSATNSGDDPALGYYVYGAGYNSNLVIGEYIIHGGSIPSSNDIDRLFGYAAHRWGLTANLPGGHPYKTLAP